MKKFNIKTLYIFSFISQCLPIYAFSTILFIERGQSVSNIAMLIAIWSVFTIILEMPSGVLTDRWNRRNIISIAAASKGLCFITWFFSHTFIMFAIGFMFWAVSSALKSGAQESLIYDNLKSDGCEESFINVYGKVEFYEKAGAIVGIASAGAISMFLRIDILALISAIICFASAILALQIRERNLYSGRLSEKPASFLETFKGAGVFIKGHRIVLFSLLFLVLFANMGDYLEEFDALIINDWELSNLWVSAIMIVGSAFVALGGLLAPMIQKKISSVNQIFFINVLAYVTLAIFAVIWNQYAILFYGISFMVLVVSKILLVNVLQREIKEEGRATVMSFYGVGANMMMICFSLLYALLAGIFTLQQVYIIMSILGIGGGLCFILLLKATKAGRS